MNVFEAVKQSVTTRQAAEHYGIRVNRNGMACCPFHNDKTPSMKLDKRFHCFGCGADGDVIDFVAALYGLGKKEAAAQLASDFGLAYEDWKPPGRARKPKPRQKSPEEQFREAKAHCFRVLADYLHLLRVFGVTYDAEKDQWYFNGEEVRYFRDVLTSNGESLTSGKFRGEMRTLGSGVGTIDIYTVRDYGHLNSEHHGTLTGIEKYSQEELDEHTQAGMSGNQPIGNASHN